MKLLYNLWYASKCIVNCDELQINPNQIRESAWLKWCLQHKSNHDFDLLLSALLHNFVPVVKPSINSLIVHLSINKTGYSVHMYSSFIVRVCYWLYCWPWMQCGSSSCLAWTLHTTHHQLLRFNSHFPGVYFTPPKAWCDLVCVESTIKP